MLRSDLCDYINACIAVKRKIDLGITGNNDMTEKGVAFKNNAPFRSCISKISNIFIDNVEDLDIVIPMFNLLEYGDDCCFTSGS